MSTSNYRTVMEKLFASGEAVQYRKGEVVFPAGEPATHLYRIREGFIKVYTLNSRGEEQLHVVYGAGDVFPLPSLLDETTNNIEYCSFSDLTVQRIPLSELRERLQSNADLAYAAMQQAIDQYKVHVARVYSLEFRFARERLAHRLLALASRFGTRTADGVEIRAPLTQQMLASSINLSRETVSREMERFVAKGYIVEISRSGAPLVICDPVALQKEIPESPLFPGSYKKLLQ